MKKILILSCLVFFNFISVAQFETDIKNFIVKAVNEKKTANTKDILTTLFRAGINNLLGEKKEFAFSSSFYGIDSIFRGTGAYSKNYSNERILRSNSFNLIIKGDSSNNIAEIGGAFTLTLINKKDIEYTKISELNMFKVRQSVDMFAEVRKDVNMAIVVKKLAPASQLQASWTAADAAHDYTLLDSLIIAELQNIITDNTRRAAILVKINSTMPNNKLKDVELVNFVQSYVNGKDQFDDQVQAIIESYARKPLLTFSPSFAYNRQDKQAVYATDVKFTVGLGKNYNKKPWEVEAIASIKIANDTSVKSTNYDNKPLAISLGVNKVLIENSNKESKMEFKFFTQYDYQLGKVPAGKDAGVFTLNSTFRVNVYKSLWLPLTLKYDPDNDNFLGVFSITANLGD